MSEAELGTVSTRTLVGKVAIQIFGDALSISILLWLLRLLRLGDLEDIVTCHQFMYQPE